MKKLLILFACAIIAIVSGFAIYNYISLQNQISKKETEQHQTKGEEVTAVLMNQINQEMNASYIYLSLSSYYSSVGLPGFAHWMRIQSQEEYQHAMLIYDFALNRGERIILDPISAPPNTWESPLSATKAALTQEDIVTGYIKNIYTIAKKDNDKDLLDCINWFIAEQVQETTTVQRLIYRLELIGNDKKALAEYDKELSKRVIEHLSLKTNEH